MDATITPEKPRFAIRSEALAVFLLLLLVTLIAWPGMKSPLLLDDLDQLAHVSRFKSWRDCFGGDSFGLFRPAKNFIYYTLGDLPLLQWHALNLSIYLGSIIAVYLLLKRLLGKPLWALAATALWATCPTQASTAVWMSCVNISLSMIFSSACLVCHDRSREKPGRALGWIALTSLMLFLGECAYETAVSMPILCVLVDRLRKRRIFSKEAFFRYGILAGVTLVFLLVRSKLGAVHSVKSANFGFAPDLEGWQLTASAPWFLWRHLSMWLMPAGRIEFCSTYLWGISASPVDLAWAWGGLLMIIGVIWVTVKRQPWIAFGLLWFLATSFPSSNFIPTWAGPIEDYYLVFPGIGLAIALLGLFKLLVAWARQTTGDPQGLRRISGVAVLSIIGIWRLLCLPLFWYQANLWNHPLSLYLNCDLTRPAQFQVQGLAARELLIRGDLEQARELARKSYETGPWYSCGSMILGCVALESNDLVEAENRFRETIRLCPQDTPVHDFSRIKLARTLIIQDDKRSLVREVLLPLLKNLASPQHLKAIHLQVDCYLRENRPADALRAANKAVQLHPNEPSLAELLKGIQEKFPALPPSTGQPLAN